MPTKAQRYYSRFRRLTGRRQATDSHMAIVLANTKLLRRLGKLRAESCDKRWQRIREHMERGDTPQNILYCPEGWTGERAEYFLSPLKNKEVLCHVCWGCGIFREGWKMTRAHVISNWSGGLDVAENYFLLCDVCHEDQPDEAIRSVQEEWLVKRKFWEDRIYHEVMWIMRDIQTELPTNLHKKVFFHFGFYMLHKIANNLRERQPTSSHKKFLVAYKSAMVGLASKWVRKVAGVSETRLGRYLKKCKRKSANRLVQCKLRDERVE